MIKKIMPLIIVLVVILTGCSTSKKTSSDENISIVDIDWSSYEVKDITLDGSLDITEGGVYNITGSIDNGKIKINTTDNVKLVLNNVSINNNNGECIKIKKSENVYIELNGDNTLTGVVNEDDDSVIISSANIYFEGDGTLNINSNIDGIQSKSNIVFKSGTYNIKTSDDGIKSKYSIIIYDGIFNIKSGGDGIKNTEETSDSNIELYNGTFKIIASKDGITSLNNVVVSDGKYSITSGGELTDSSMKGIKASNEITINGGTFDIDSSEDAIHSNNKITINNGDITISAGDDGIHSENEIVINDGNINITKSYEGIESYNITIKGGDISLISSDDGVNVTNPPEDTNTRYGMDQDTGGKLIIEDGNIYVNASGDGLDSNGRVEMTGGIVYVDGPTNSGNGALDYNGSFNISGGTLVAVGASGMAQNVSSNSTQNSVIINLDSITTGKLELNGIVYEPKKQYQSIVISSPKLELNKEYELKIDDKVNQTITLTNTVTSIGNGGMNGGMTGRGMRGGR